MRHKSSVHKTQLVVPSARILTSAQDRLSRLIVRLPLSLALITLVTLGTLTAPAIGHAEDTSPREYDGVEITNKLGAQTPLNLKFKDEEGHEVTLSQYFNQDKPVLLIFVYFNCPMLCSMVLNKAIEGLQDLGWIPGQEFEALTVSISPTEGPELARDKKANYMKMLNLPKAEEGWHFLTGEHEAIKTLADTMGFGYRYDPSTQDYAHGAALFFLSPEGRLTRVFKGIDFPAKQLRLAFTESSDGKLGTFLDQILMRCFRYEPSHQKYGFYIWGAMRLGGLVTIFCLGLLLTLMWRHERRKKYAQEV